MHPLSLGGTARSVVGRTPRLMTFLRLTGSSTPATIAHPMADTIQCDIRGKGRLVCICGRKLLAISLVAVLFAAGARAQSLGDLAREQRQKKASAGQSGVAAKAFSNLDNPPSQAVTGSRRSTGKANSGRQALLRIDSPADGTVVSPGETISVSVSSSNGASLSHVALLGENDLGDLGNPPASSWPAHFSVTIPRDISCRRYALTAVATYAGRELVESDSIELDVERPDMPVSLSELNLSSLIDQSQGATYQLEMLATFADGSVVDVSESSKLSFHSTDTRIVTVDDTGNTMAMATGHAELIVSYSNSNGQELQHRIPVTVLPFQVTFTPSSLDFGEVAVGSSAKLAITVSNTTVANSLLMILSVTATGSYSESENCVSSSPLPLDGTCEITVTFTPAAVGPSPGTLSVPDSTGGHSVILLSGVGSSK